MGFDFWQEFFLDAESYCKYEQLRRRWTPVMALAAGCDGAAPSLRGRRAKRWGRGNPGDRRAATAGCSFQEPAAPRGSPLRLLAMTGTAPFGPTANAISAFLWSRKRTGRGFPSIRRDCSIQQWRRVRDLHPPSIRPSIQRWMAPPQAVPLQFSPILGETKR